MGPVVICVSKCIVLCSLHRVMMMVVVAASCCCTPYRLALLLGLTFAPCVLTFAPCVLTFASCIMTFASSACGFSTGTNIPPAHRWWLSPVATCAGDTFYSAHCTNSPLAHVHMGVYITLRNLYWRCFFIQPLAQFLHLHSDNLHWVVVVVCGGGGIYI